MPTIGDCWQLYSQQHLTETVADRKNQSYWSRLSWFKDIQAEGLTPTEVRDYITHRGYPEGVMASTINRELGLLRACLRFAERERRIERAPIVKALPKAATRVRALSKVQARTLLQAAVRRDIWQETAFLMLALGTAQRPGAIVDLTWDRAMGDTLDFRVSTPKSSRMKGRAIVPVNKLAKRALAIAHRHKRGPYVLHHDGRKVSRIDRLLRRVGDECGIVVTPHMLRHTAASLLLQDGVDLLRVSRLLAHANTIVTQTVYFHHQPSWLKDTIDKLSYD